MIACHHPKLQNVGNIQSNKVWIFLRHPVFIADSNTSNIDCSSDISTFPVSALTLLELANSSKRGQFYHLNTFYSQKTLKWISRTAGAYRIEESVADVSFFISRSRLCYEDDIWSWCEGFISAGLT